MNDAGRACFRRMDEARTAGSCWCWGHGLTISTDSGNAHEARCLQGLYEVRKQAVDVMHEIATGHIQSPWASLLLYTSY